MTDDASLQEQIDALAATAEDHGRQLVALSAGGGGEGRPRVAHPPSSALLGRADGDQSSRRAWEDLGAWVTWLVSTYELEDHWPWCWYRHAGLVQEMAALHRWHVWAVSPEAPAHEAVQWHDALSRVEARYRAVTETRCGKGHRETPDETQQRRRGQAEESTRGLGDFIAERGR